MSPAERIRALELSHAELRAALLAAGRELTARKMTGRRHAELLKIMRRVIRESRALKPKHL